jgi:hypothetical protein
MERERGSQPCTPRRTDYLDTETSEHPLRRCRRSWPDPEKVDELKVEFCPILIFVIFSRFLDR